MADRHARSLGVSPGTPDPSVRTTGDGGGPSPMRGQRVGTGSLRSRPVALVAVLRCCTAATPRHLAPQSKLPVEAREDGQVSSRNCEIRSDKPEQVQLGHVVNLLKFMESIVIWVVVLRGLSPLPGSVVRVGGHFRNGGRRV